MRGGGAVGRVRGKGQSEPLPLSLPHLPSGLPHAGGAGRPLPGPAMEPLTLSFQRRFCSFPWFLFSLQELCKGCGSKELQEPPLLARGLEKGSLHTDEGSGESGVLCGAFRPHLSLSGGHLLGREARCRAAALQLHVCLRKPVLWPGREKTAEGPSLGRTCCFLGLLCPEDDGPDPGDLPCGSERSPE